MQWWEDLSIFLCYSYFWQWSLSLSLSLLPKEILRLKSNLSISLIEQLRAQETVLLDLLMILFGEFAMPTGSMLKLPIFLKLNNKCFCSHLKSFFSFCARNSFLPLYCLTTRWQAVIRTFGNTYHHQKRALLILEDAREASIGQFCDSDKIHHHCTKYYIFCCW